MRQQWTCVFPSAEPAPARSSLECANRRVAQDKFFQFIGHTSDPTKLFCPRRLSISKCPLSHPKLWIDHANCLMRRSRPVGSQLFKTKSPDLLMAEAAAPERQMKRTLNAFDLTCIGIGAIIGTGIFALIGTAIAGQTFPTRLETPVLNFIQAWLSGADVVLGRAGAGPAVAISLFVAALACGFAALCYAELASMIPVSGSAYTYSYATLGEIVAWIIGWDLILEYAVGNM